MGYNLSRKAQLQRQNAALKEGYRSEILKKLSNCHTCFYRNYCHKKDKMSLAEQNRGCEDVKQAFIAKMQEFTFPEIKIMKLISDIEVESEFKKVMDGKDQEGLSKDRMRLYYLFKDLMKLLLEYKDVKAKYTVGTKQQIDVIHKFEDNEVFTVDEKEIK